MLLEAQSRRNKSREPYDIRQESGFRQNKWKKMRGEMLASMQKFQSTMDRDDEFKGHMVREGAKGKYKNVHDVGWQKEKEN